MAFTRSTKLSSSRALACIFAHSFKLSAQKSFTLHNPTINNTNNNNKDKKEKNTSKKHTKNTNEKIHTKNTINNNLSTVVTKNIQFEEEPPLSTASSMTQSFESITAQVKQQVNQQLNRELSNIDTTMNSLRKDIAELKVATKKRTQMTFLNTKS